MKALFQAEALSVWHFLDYFHYIYNLCFPKYFTYSFHEAGYLDSFRLQYSIYEVIL